MVRPGNQQSGKIVRPGGATISGARRRNCCQCCAVGWAMPSTSLLSLAAQDCQRAAIKVSARARIDRRIYIGSGLALPSAMANSFLASGAQVRNAVE